MVTSEFAQSSLGNILFEHASLNSPSGIRLALSQNADPNWKHPVNGWHAIHWAAVRDSLEALKLLVAENAQLDLETAEGKRVIDLAPVGGRVAKWLKETMGLELEQIPDAKLQKRALLPSCLLAQSELHQDVQPSRETSVSAVDKVDYLQDNGIQERAQPLASEEPPALFNNPLITILPNQAQAQTQTYTYNQSQIQAPVTPLPRSQFPKLDLTILSPKWDGSYQSLGSLCIANTTLISKLPVIIAEQIDAVDSTSLDRMFRKRPGTAFSVPLNWKQGSQCIDSVFRDGDHIVLQLPSVVVPPW